MARGTPIGAIRLRRVLFDVNVLVAYFLHRQSEYQDVDKIVEASLKGAVDIYIAAFSVPMLFYLLERDLEKADLTPLQAEAEALTDVRFCLDAFLICPVDYGELYQALSLPGRDYEDNLQIVCAINSHLDAIITSDKKFHSNDITVLTPAQAVKRLGR